jgi:hypothetical protein
VSIIHHEEPVAVFFTVCDTGCDKACRHHRHHNVVPGDIEAELRHQGFRLVRWPERDRGEDLAFQCVPIQ